LLPKNFALLQEKFALLSEKFALQQEKFALQPEKFALSTEKSALPGTLKAKHRPQGASKLEMTSSSSSFQEHDHVDSAFLLLFQWWGHLLVHLAALALGSPSALDG
jgi:hypothetical protein